MTIKWPQADRFVTQSIAIPHASPQEGGAWLNCLSDPLTDMVTGGNRRTNPRESADPPRALTVGQCSFPHQTPPRSSKEPLGGSQTLPVHHSLMREWLGEDCRPRTTPLIGTPTRQ